jgi:single-strand DNA-binding protein
VNARFKGEISMNKVMIIGRLTRNPELRYTSSNTPVASFTLAINKRLTQNGAPSADFIPVTAWQKTAEFICKHFRKGSKIAIVGRLQSKSWEDTEGRKNYIVEIVVEEVDFAESKQINSADPADNSDNSGYFPVDDDTVPF